MKILLVEDEEALSGIVKEELQGKGHEVKVAADGEEALVFAKTFQPNMILLDLVLPKKNGMEVLSALKIDPELKKIPVIVLSNLAEDESIKRAIGLGADDYFVKTQHSIYEVIEKVQKFITPVL
jgi:DNA-binding response OmpR family regulator